MSTFSTSRNTRTQHVSPKWESRPYRIHPSRREHIFGKVQGIPDQREPLWWRVVFVLTMTICTLYALKLAVIG